MDAATIDLVWKLATIVVPLVFTWFKGKQVSNERWAVLLGIAEVAWEAVEAWKAGRDKMAPAALEDEFMRRMVDMAHGHLNGIEKVKLREWAKSRSMADKARKAGTVVKLPLNGRE